MPDRPNILLVHGAWGDASHWRHVIPPLHEKGYRVFAAQNPLTVAVGRCRLHQQADCRCKRPLRCWSDMPMVAPSSRGLATCQMSWVLSFWPDLLSMKERASRVLWARRAPPEGAANIRQDKYGFLWIAPEKFRETFCNDLDETESLIWALTQKPTSPRCFEERSGPPAWKVKPSWYQISTNDRLIPPETENFMAERIRARKTITLPTSHASVATHPNEIVDLIEEASRAVM